MDVDTGTDPFGEFVASGRAQVCVAQERVAEEEPGATWSMPEPVQSLHEVTNQPDPGEFRLAGERADVSNVVVAQLQLTQQWPVGGGW